VSSRSQRDSGAGNSAEGSDDGRSDEDDRDRTSDAEIRKATAGTARLTAITVLLGVLIVLLSQIVTGYTLVDETDSVITNVTLFDTHGLIVALFALVAALALVFAVATGSRSAVAVVISMGIGILLVFLFIDVPDVGDTGFFDAPGVGNIDATGKTSAGFWMELVGALVILLGAAALARMDESQLRAIGPDRNGSAPASSRPSTGSRSSADSR
jgi:hypothetical protein